MDWIIDVHKSRRQTQKITRKRLGDVWEFLLENGREACVHPVEYGLGP